MAWGPWDASRGLALGRCSPVLVTPGGFSYLGPGAASSPPVAVLSPPARDSGEFPLPHPHLALDSVTCLDLESQRSPHPSGDSEDQCPPQAHPPWGPCPCLLRPCPPPRRQPPFTWLDLLRQKGVGMPFCDCWVLSSSLGMSVPALDVGESPGCAALSGTDGGVALSNSSRLSPPLWF